MHSPSPSSPTATVGEDEPASSVTDGEAPAGDDAEGAAAPDRTDRGRRPGAVRRWAGRLVSLVLTLAVLGIAALAVALTAVPAAVDGHASTVLSGSMVPEFSPGAVVVDRPVPASSLQVGDVITYETTDASGQEPVLITHRVVAIEQGADGPLFTTQGDANADVDERPVSASQVRGEVWYSVPHVGQARDLLLAQGAPLVVGGVAGLVLALYLLSWAFRSDPEPRTGAGGPREGRHRARTVGTGAVLVGLVASGAPLAPGSAGTYAHLSDQVSVPFTITTAGAAADRSPGPGREAVHVPAPPTGAGEAAAPESTSAADAPGTPPAGTGTGSVAPELPPASAEPDPEAAAAIAPGAGASDSSAPAEPAPTTAATSD